MTPGLQLVPEPDQACAVVYVRVSTKEQLQGEGDPDGYSIPAQREACLPQGRQPGRRCRRGFVERGETARSADRPELQRMLAYLTSGRHRLRHRPQGRPAGPQPARRRRHHRRRFKRPAPSWSASPRTSTRRRAALLLHGIMSSIAEFYSRNLANEVMKGTQQKVGRRRHADTSPRSATCNVRQVIDGARSAPSSSTRSGSTADQMGLRDLRHRRAQPAAAGRRAGRARPAAAADPEAGRPAAAGQQAARPAAQPLLHRLRHLARRRVPGQAPGLHLGRDLRARCSGCWPRTGSPASAPTGKFRVAAGG